MTVVYPSWVWLTEPEHNFLTASYSLDLSTEHSVTRRSLFQSPWFQRLFGDRFQFAGDRNQVAQYANDRRGQMIATSVGAILGFVLPGSRRKNLRLICSATSCPKRKPSTREWR